MSFLRTFAVWLAETELAARPDARRIADELVAVASRIAGGVEGVGRVLDLGSGTGSVAFAAADLGTGVTALDIDASALARGRGLARSVAAPLTHVLGDARALPFKDRSFDATVHRSVLVYMTDRERAVAEERRVLRPGGSVSASESLGSSLDLETEDRGIARVWASGLGEILTGAPDVLTLSGARLQELYLQQGFSDIAVEEVPIRVRLDSADAVARAFVSTPPAGVSARTLWERAGVPGDLLDEFLARLAAQAERGPAVLLTTEAFLVARAP